MPPKKRRRAPPRASVGRGRREMQPKRPRTKTTTSPCPPAGDDHTPSPSSPDQQAEEQFSFPGPSNTMGELLGNQNNQIADFDLDAYTPTPTVSCFDPVGKLIPPKLKQKIWEGQFIDLGLLLKSRKEINDYLGGHGEVHVRDGKFCVYQQKTPTFLTIEKWTSAFVIFISVMIEKYRTRGQELLKYLRDVRLAASRAPTGWYRYDEQFRLRMADDPHASWGQINQEYWLLYVNSSSSSVFPKMQVSARLQELWRRASQHPLQQEIICMTWVIPRYIWIKFLSILQTIQMLNL